MAEAAVAALGVGTTAGGLIGTFCPPCGEALESWAWSGWQIRRTPVESIILQRYRGIIKEDDFNGLMAQWGFDYNRRHNLYKLAEVMLDADTLLTLKWRGEITEVVFNDKMSKIGFVEETRKFYEKSRKFLPSVGDLIRFSVRDVYYPEVIAKYGMDKEFPAKFTEEAAMQGMSEERAKQFWVSHWVLPALGDVMTMLHRLSPDYVDAHPNEFTEMGLSTEGVKTDLATVKEIIKRHDVEPYWRERLVAITYEPYTRVDVRRMYELGVLTKDDVYWNYRQLGYNHEKATKLTEWTEKYYSRTDSKTVTKQKEATYSMLKQFYDYRFIDDVGFEGGLQDLDYDAETAHLIRLVTDAETSLRLRIEEAMPHVYKYQAGQMTQADLHDKLTQIGLPETVVVALMTKAEVKRAEQVKLLTMTQLISLWLEGIRTKDEVEAYLTRMGYEAKDVKDLMTFQLKKHVISITIKRAQAGTYVRSEAEALFKEAGYTDKEITEILAWIEKMYLGGAS